MASNYTTTYNLNQWAPTDPVLRTEFNTDNIKIDAALRGKASASALSTLQSTVAGKASQASLDALKTTVSEQGTALELRNCRFVTGSYQGSGTCGENGPNTLTFPYKPVFLFVAAPNYLASIVATIGQSMVWLSVNNDRVTEIFSWKSKSVSWYNEPNLSASSATKQLNAADTTYHYFAILSLDE